MNPILAAIVAVTIGLTMFIAGGTLDSIRLLDNEQPAQHCRPMEAK